MNLKKQVNDILERGVTKVIVRETLEKKLLSGKKIKLYLGIDPTGFDLHLGHAVPLRKLRQFQKLGHEVILLFGGFTAQIGDPSGRDEMRRPLTYEEVMENAGKYKEQAKKILDFEGENPVKIMNNATWLAPMSFSDVIKLASHFTVQQMMERDMFQERIKNEKPIGVHEFLYPLMQGYDSVAMDVDLEIAGNDQLFNVLAGRTLQDKINGKEKHALTFALLEGTDGRKMSKTYNNHIPLDANAKDMFGKIMSIKDELIVSYFTLCTEVEMEKIAEYREAMKKGENPRTIKLILASEIVSLYHNADEAKIAQEQFISQFSKKELPDDIEVRKIDGKKHDLQSLIYTLKLAASKGEAKRLIEQGGVKVNNEKVLEPTVNIELSTEKTLIQVGKRQYIYLTN